MLKICIINVKNMYNTIKANLETGMDPVTIGKKSTHIKDNIFLIKKGEARVLVKVTDGKVEILGVGARKNRANIKSFKKLMKKLYDVRLEGYN